MKRAAPAVPPPVPIPRTFHERARTADGKRTAIVTQTDDFHGMFHEDESWLIEVQDEAGDRIFSTGRNWSGYVNDLDSSRDTGVRVTGVAFDDEGRLLIGTGGAAFETVTLPPALPVAARVALENCRAALQEAWPERWQILSDGVEALLWPRDESCRVCSGRTSTVVCEKCKALCARRAAMGAPPDPAMVLAETIRALHAKPPENLAELIATLEAQASRVISDSPCTVCGKTVRALADLRSPAGRVCAPCVVEIATRPV